MTVKPLGDDFSGSDEDVKEIKRKLTSWKEMYELNLISEDFTSTQILVKLSVDADADAKEAMYRQIREILKDSRNSEVDYYLAGDPAVYCPY